MSESEGLLRNFKVRNAKDFVDYINSQVSSLYVLLGKITEWPDDENPPAVDNTLTQEVNIWSDASGLKRIKTNDAALGFRKVAYERGRSYDIYDNTVNLENKDFYVITDENNVYKCINNANGGISTVKPTHFKYENISTEFDGYRWKYMFTISESLIEKYIAPDFVPINIDTDVINNAVPGTIDNLKITSAGSGYRPIASVNGGNEIPVYVAGDGDQNSSASINVTTSGEGEIVGFTFASGGNNYPYPNEKRQPIAIRQITANGIVENAYGIASTNINGQISDVEVIVKGTGYVNGTAQIVQSSCRAYAETNADGELINTDIFTAREGANFTKATAVIVDPTGTGGSIVPIISPLNGHGSNPEKELFANYVMLNLRLSGEAVFLDQDTFRRIGIIEDPVTFGTSDNINPLVLTQDAVDAKYRLKIESPTANFTVGERIYGESSGTIGVETSILDDETLRVIVDDSLSSDFGFFNGELIRGLESGEGTVITDITDPQVDYNSGTILYINNREPVVRNSEFQVETVTLVIEY
jgi:hypothetical protein